MDKKPYFEGTTAEGLPCYQSVLKHDDVQTTQVAAVNALDTLRLLRPVWIDFLQLLRKRSAEQREERHEAVVILRIEREIRRLGECFVVVVVVFFSELLELSWAELLEFVDRQGFPPWFREKLNAERKWEPTQTLTRVHVTVFEAVPPVSGEGDIRRAVIHAHWLQ